jgi:hypothetical protein
MWILMIFKTLTFFTEIDTRTQFLGMTGTRIVGKKRTEV